MQLSHAHDRPEAASPGRRPGPAKYIATFGVIGAAIIGLFGLASTQSAGAVDGVYGIWAASVVPADVSENDSDSVEVGVEFSASTPGSVSGVQFYRASANVGPHTGHLWSSSGQVLATVKFPETTATGWRTATFSKPVHIEAGQRYVASYTAPDGHYAADDDYFLSRRSVTSGALTAWRGVYDYSLGMPRDVYRGSNYYVDVLFSEDTAPDSPDSTSSSPSDPTTAPKPTVAPTATVPPAPTVAPSSPTSSPTASASSGTGLPTFATAATTGITSTKLTSYTGQYKVSQAGAVVENLDIHGSLVITAPDVTVRNVRVSCSNSWWVVRADVARVTIQDSIFTVDRSDPDNYCEYGMLIGSGAKVYRNEISYTPNGVTFAGGSAEVVGNWIHDQIAYPGKGDHVDGIELGGGGSGPFVIRNNAIYVPEGQTGCLSLFADFGTIKNVVADGNLFDGAGYSVYGGTSSASDVRFTNNWFGRSFYSTGGRYGPVTRFDSSADGNVWTNNRWLDTKALVSGSY